MSNFEEIMKELGAQEYREEKKTDTAVYTFKKHVEFLERLMEEERHDKEDLDAYKSYLYRLAALYKAEKGEKYAHPKKSITREEISFIKVLITLCEMQGEYYRAFVTGELTLSSLEMTGCDNIGKAITAMDSYFEIMQILLSENE